MLVFVSFVEMLLLSALVSISLLTSTTAQFGVYFTQNQDMFVSYSSWLVTLTVDLAPYDDQMTIIFDELQALQASLDALTESSKNLSSTDETRMWREESVQLILDLHKLFGHEFQELRLALQSVKLLSRHDSQRSKRSLLPFVGNFMKSLFGTATHSDLRDLKQYLQETRHIQSQVIHVVKESVSILNTTHQDVAMNRKLIHQLQNVSEYYRNQLNLLIDVVTHPSLDPFKVFTKLAIRSHDIANILNFHMKHLLHDITRITDDIESSIQGDLPLTLITPKQLFSVLSNVSHNLPPGTNLPLSLSNTNLLTFYKHLHTLVVPFENRFHIVIALPLTVSAYQFNLFSALSMPYTPADLNLTVQYALENSQIAISLNRKYYALISTSESSLCQQTPICALRSPIFNVDTYSSCILALFFRNETLVKTTCKTHISPAKSLPVVKYLSLGHWIVSTPKMFDLSISCLDIKLSNTQTMTPGLNSIQLKNGCSANSTYFTIPTFEQGNTDISLHYQVLNEIKINQLSNNLWEGEKGIMKNLRMLKDKINDHQTPINKISDFEFQKLDFFLDNLQSANSTPVAHHVVWGSSIACLLIIVVVIVLIYKCRLSLYKLFCKKRAAATKSIEEPKNEQNLELMNDRPQFA